MKYFFISCFFYIFAEKLKTMNKKYILTDIAIKKYGTNHMLYKIRALRDFSNVKKGDLGGFVESEDNLSQEDDCWIYNNAIVCSRARVYGNAKIYGGTKIEGSARIFENAIVCGNARVSHNAKIHGNAQIGGCASVFHCAEVYDNAKIDDYAYITNHATVYGNAIIHDNSRISNYAKVYGNSRICGRANIYDNAEINDNVIIGSNSRIFNNAKISGDIAIYGFSRIFGNIILHNDYHKEYYDAFLWCNFNQNELYKFFIRFLKENNLYNDFITSPIRTEITPSYLIRNYNPIKLDYIKNKRLCYTLYDKWNELIQFL